MLYEESWKLMRSECERIAFELRAEISFIESIISDFWLFKNDDTFFWSESVLERINVRNEKSEKARVSAENRWKKKEENANAMRTHNERNAIKERKGKEISNNTNVLLEDTPAQKARDFFLMNPSDVAETMWIADLHKNSFIEEIWKFQKYWTEKNKSWTKSRWELEKTFEVHLRLATWFKRANKDFNSQPQQSRRWVEV